MNDIKIVENGWEKLKHHLLNQDPCASEKELKDAYYLGAYNLFGYIMNASQEVKDDEIGELILDSIEKEIREYVVENITGE